MFYTGNLYFNVPKDMHMKIYFGVTTKVKFCCVVIRCVLILGAYLIAGVCHKAIKG